MTNPNSSKSVEELAQQKSIDWLMEQPAHDDLCAGGYRTGYLAGHAAAMQEIEASRTDDPFEAIAYRNGALAGHAQAAGEYEATVTTLEETVKEWWHSKEWNRDGKYYRKFVNDLETFRARLKS